MEFWIGKCWREGSCWSRQKKQMFLLYPTTSMKFDRILDWEKCWREGSCWSRQKKQMFLLYPTTSMKFDKILDWEKINFYFEIGQFSTRGLYNCVEYFYNQHKTEVVGNFGLGNVGEKEVVGVGRKKQMFLLYLTTTSIKFDRILDWEKCWREVDRPLLLELKQMGVIETPKKGLKNGCNVSRDKLELLVYADKHEAFVISNNFWEFQRNFGLEKVFIRRINFYFKN
ncbi:hypothetical protein CHUAL_007132 [Chamberlinius hualienensis]